ncbi:MAG TPA: T9SS type A sorting domain-containing protein [Lacibacter sp.]|nr:T9SS type A sorting domain-containing protein [Lacibacter sp.]HMO89233.1 T9SS type A sorting domain-containing protein [Lacibacter sp.]HMP87911.1 T9SS type A sorting domain-containing protein [Lacibacter sp.]
MLRSVCSLTCLFLFAALVSFPTGVQSQFLQQGSRLLPVNGINQSYFGFSVALSGDGNTAVIGGHSDNLGQGAAWVYERSGAAWLMKAKLQVSGQGGFRLGVAVAISTDGNTILLGGDASDANRGAAWVFVRQQDQWEQEAKLTGNDVNGPALMGISVALSADGNTAIVGGSHDNASLGAAWVFERDNGAWSQQGPKLVGTGSIGPAVYQGAAVALSADGSTALVGGWEDNDRVGAAWVFVRSGGAWLQQGTKLTGSDGGKPATGYAVGLSADGNTAIVGAFNGNSGRGGAYVFQRSGVQWQQAGPLIAGTDNNGPSIQGRSVSISADGKLAVISGELDSYSVGAAWVFRKEGASWMQLGTKLVGTDYVGFSNQGRSSALSADGSTILVGGFQDSGLVGAAWIFHAAEAPVMEQYHPVVAGPGAPVLLSGINFSDTVQEVRFGGVPAASFTRVNATTFEARVGNGASGKVTVKTSRGTAVMEGFVFSQATAVRRLNPGEELSLLPNPVADVLVVRFQLQQQSHMYIAVYNSSGSCLLRQQARAPQTSVSLRHLPPGLYVIHLTSPDNRRRFTHRFVKVNTP